MSDVADQIYTVANLLDVPAGDVRSALAAARRAFPDESDDELVRITIETIRRTHQRRALDAARKSVGR